MASGSPRELLDVYEGADLETLTVVFLGPDGDGDHPWHRLERGEISIVDAWPELQSMLADHGITQRVDRPAPPSIREWQVNEPVVAVLTELRDAGIRTSIVTNNVAELRSRWWNVLPFDELFDDIVDSHEVGVRKPAPAIYELAMRRVGLDDPSARRLPRRRRAQRRGCSRCRHARHLRRRRPTARGRRAARSRSAERYSLRHSLGHSLSR